MSKERLKRFKNSLDFLDDSADMSDYHRLIDTLENLYKDGELDWIHRYAREQAERVQESKELIEIINRKEVYIQFLQRQNKRYRELINNINEKAMIFGAEEQVHEAILDAIKALEGDPHESS